MSRSTAARCYAKAGITRFTSIRSLAGSPRCHGIARSTTTLRERSAKTSTFRRLDDARAATWYRREDIALACFIVHVVPVASQRGATAADGPIVTESRIDRPA